MLRTLFFRSILGRLPIKGQGHGPGICSEAIPAKLRAVRELWSKVKSSRRMIRWAYDLEALGNSRLRDASGRMRWATTCSGALWASSRRTCAGEVPRFWFLGDSGDTQNDARIDEEASWKRSASHRGRSRSTPACWTVGGQVLSLVDPNNTITNGLRAWPTDQRLLVPPTCLGVHSLRLLYGGPQRSMGNFRFFRFWTPKYLLRTHHN